jgi:hypothetical protein
MLASGYEHSGRFTSSGDQESSRAEESHLHSLTEPQVNISAHTALITQPTAEIRPPNVGTARCGNSAGFLSAIRRSHVRVSPQSRNRLYFRPAHRTSRLSGALKTLLSPTCHRTRSPLSILEASPYTSEPVPPGSVHCDVEGPSLASLTGLS